MRKNQTGQVLVTTALGLVMLLGFAGLAVDMGVMRYQRRLQQTAADGAAIAGAVDLSFGSGVTAGAQNNATQNGFTDGAGCGGGAGSVGCVSVAVNNGPLTGPHAGDAKYVEVIVTAIQPTYFMKIFGVNSETVKARAVATNVSGGSNASCLYTLGKPSSSIQGVNVQGKAHLLAPNCGISDNGNFDTTGNAYTVTSKTLGVSGGCTGNDCGNPNVTCTAFPSGQCPLPLGGAPATGDPLAALTPPAQPLKSSTCPLVGACDYSSSGTVTIQPGTYSSINISKNSVVTMAPGLYYINGSGGLGFGGSATLTGTGVMIYFTGTASLNKVNGGGNLPDVNLTPMTAAQSSSATGSDQYAGILFYQDPADLTNPWFGGDNNSTFNGTVYFPTQQLNFYGDTSINFNGTVIADSVAINGNPTVNFGVSPAGVPAPASLTTPVLVE